jgi:hypothetical protein
VHPLGAERLDTERRGHRRVDSARDRDDDVGEGVLVDVVPQAEDQRQPHLLKLRCEGSDRALDDVVVLTHRPELHELDLGNRSARALEVAAADIAQAASDGKGRLDVDDEQVLLEARCARQDLSGVVEYDRVPVEDELVLPADEVAEREVRARVARARDEHLLSILGLSDVEWGGREVHEELRSGKREVGSGRAGLPDVLADGGADVRVAEPEQDEVAPFREVAVFVEDAVVRQVLLPIDGADSAICADDTRIREVAIEPRHAHESHDIAGLVRDLDEGAACGSDEAWAKEEVLGRVAGDRQLWKDDEIRTGATRLPEEGEDLPAVPVEIADDRVQLRQGQSHSFRL